MYKKSLLDIQGVIIYKKIEPNMKNREPKYIRKSNTALIYYIRKWCQIYGRGNQTVQDTLSNM